MAMRLLTPIEFSFRLLKHVGIFALFTLVSLLGGVVGYHYTAHLGWVDSLLNASMILTGMGPVDSLQGVPAKLFATGYAIYSGVYFLSVSAILLYPIAERLMKRVHIAAARGPLGGSDADM